jgi:hypothetical protein
MAGKKPAKRNVTNATAPVVKKNEGELVLFVGLTPKVKATCPTCGKKVGKGMMRVYASELYCSKSCAVTAIEQDKEMNS